MLSQRNGGRDTDCPTLMLPAPENAVAAGGGVEGRGHVSEGAVFRAVMWALLALTPHDPFDGRPHGRERIAFDKSAHKGRSPNHPVPDKQVVQCGVIIPHQNGFHIYAEKHKCD